MTFWQIAVTALAGAFAGAGLLVAVAVVASHVEKWWAARGGRFPWEKD